MHTSNQGSVQRLGAGVALAKPGVVANGIVYAQLLGCGAGGSTVVRAGGGIFAIALQDDVFVMIPGCFSMFCHSPAGRCFRDVFEMRFFAIALREDVEMP